MIVNNEIVELDAKTEAAATYCGSGYCCFGSSREMAI